MTEHVGISDVVLQGAEKIIILAPHPDDETLACGGLLMRAFAGAGAHVVCLTDGGASHPGSIDWPPTRLAAKRRRELMKALTLLGGDATDLTWLGLPDSRLHEADALSVIATLEQVITAHNASHIFVPANEDKHCDHQTTARMAALLRGRRTDLNFYSYPVWSRWDDPAFDQTAAAYAPVFLDTKPLSSRKEAAIRAHRSQLGQIVQDDPEGFVLPQAFIEKFVGENEIFWRMP